MNASERLAAAAEKFADTVAQSIAAQVELAVALERDRHDAELTAIRRRLEWMENNGSWNEAALEHSRRVGDAWAEGLRR